MISRSVRDDIEDAKRRLSQIGTSWDGKECILELKDADENWRQMEWVGFYFEYICKEALRSSSRFSIPGERKGTNSKVIFDALGEINWDFKAKAIKSDDHRGILNDIIAVNQTISERGAYGAIIALCDVEYNDDDRTFQKWHSQLKGGPSKYEIERKKRTSVSRYRKTQAQLTEILFVVATSCSVSALETMNQGRNSNGTPRNPKYMINLEEIDDLLIDRIQF